MVVVMLYIVWRLLKILAAGQIKDEKSYQKLNNPRVGSAGNVILSDVDGDAGMDTEEAETVCVDLELTVVLTDKS